MFHLDHVNGPLELTQRRPHGCALPALCHGGGWEKFSLVSYDSLKGGNNWPRRWKYRWITTTARAVQVNFEPWQHSPGSIPPPAWIALTSTTALRCSLPLTEPHPVLCVHHRIHIQYTGSALLGLGGSPSPIAMCWAHNEVGISILLSLCGALLRAHMAWLAQPREALLLLMPRTKLDVKQELIINRPIIIIIKYGSMNFPISFAMALS